MNLVVTVVDAAVTRELRRAVLRPNLPVGAPLPADDLAGVVHLAAFDGTELLSVCLIYPEQCPWQPGRPAWRLRGMASDPVRRGTGAATAVITEAHRIAAEAGAELIWCQARETAQSFYERAGWRATGDLFESVGVPHRNMSRDL